MDLAAGSPWLLDVVHAQCRIALEVTPRVNARADSLFFGDRGIRRKSRQASRPSTLPKKDLVDDRDRFVHIIGHMEDLKVVRRDRAVLLRQRRAHPLQKRCPECLANQDDGERNDLEGLDEGERLEEFVERAEAAGEDDESARVLHEHDLAHEEVAEGEFDALVRVWLLLKRERDVQAHGSAARLDATLVGGFHDARAAPGDDRKLLRRQHAATVDRPLVLGFRRRGAGRAEDRHGVSDARERVGGIDEFAHDPEGAPGLMLQRLLDVL